MGDDTDDSWLASRRVTNQLLAFGIVVLAAGFVSVGTVGPAGIQFLSETLLVLVLVAATVAFLGWLAWT